MRTYFALATFLASLSLAQTPTPANVQLATLPSELVSTGIAWNRYNAAVPFSETTSLAIRVGVSNVYSWSTLDTPISPTSVGQPPQLSSIRTGAAYVFAQSPTANVSAFMLGDIGIATSQTATLSQYSGGMGIAWRYKRTNFFVMPMYRIIGTGSIGVQTVPEIQLGYSFGK